MAITDLFKIDEIKRERDAYKAILQQTERMEIHEVKKLLAELIAQRDTISKELENLRKQIDDRKKEVIFLDDEILLQSFGFYKPRYGLENSEAYKRKLDEIRADQAAMVKGGKAASGATNWTVNNSAAEGQRMIKDHVKLILRSFNNECDASISGVKFNNVVSIEKKIIKAFEALNKLEQRMTITISRPYLDLKLRELYLVYEYQVKKQEEKEEQKRIREKMREEAKLMKEIEEARLKIEKEQNHFVKAISNINWQIQKAQTDVERQILEKEKTSYEEKLTELAKEQEVVDYREQNTRAGYVYIISNVGAFGENIYKIGVTRRLDPAERIDELGDASVPFDFDTHALIFSDDAPTLERALHKAFEHTRLNLINLRREFFRASIEDIEKVVRENFGKPVEFVMLADAPQYRQSEMLRTKQTIQ
jgi:chromosome segregation ATPase